MSFKAIGVAGAVLGMVGCTFTNTPHGPVQRESKSIELDQAELAKVTLKMAAGTLNVKGGSSKLMDADFTYNVLAWKPEVRYVNTGARADLTIEQPAKGGQFGEITYIWDLRLNDRVPIDFVGRLGAGEATLNLGDLTLRSIGLEMGAGELKLDLRGHPKRSYAVDVQGGVGEATIHLPPDVGIDADVQGGIGSISAVGLQKEGDRYVNDALQKAAVKIHLNIRGGIGNINLLAQ